MFRFLSSPISRMFLLSLAVYVITGFLGYAVSQVQGGGDASRKTIEAVAQVLGPMANLEPPFMMVAIFLNNSIKALAIILLGFTLGVVPFIFLAVNGVVTGLVIGEIGELAGVGVAVAALAPHGIIEIPALLLASALGFLVSRATVRRIMGREDRPGKELKRSLTLFLQIVLPALLVASAVEAFVTPLLIQR